MTADPITSPANPRIKQLVRLRNRRERTSTGLFVIEGFRELTRAVAADLNLLTLYVSPELWLGPNENGLVDAAVANGTEVVEVSPEPFRKASYRDRPEGLLGVARQFATGLDRVPVSDVGLYLVAESIEKPGNLGTMMRTSLAAGVDGVIVCDPTTDIFNPNVIRASLGSVFSIPVGVSSTPETIEWCRSHGITTVAATPDATTAHFATDMTGPTAIVVGSEQYGLGEEWLKAAEARAVIPMPGSMDSLNAAMSAGILVFEAVRQRS